MELLWLSTQRPTDKRLRTPTPLRALCVPQPLLSLYDECGPSTFLDGCLLLLQLDCTGLLLAWAFEYAQEEPHVLFELLQQQRHEQQIDAAEQKLQPVDEVERSLSGLVAYVNRQAAFHECFPGNERVGRMRAPV